MIAKLHKGKGFRAALEYALRVSKGYVLDTDMGSDTPRGLSREFNQIRQLRPEIKRPMHFVSLSIHPEEHLTDQQWKEVTRHYIKNMGFIDNQYVAIKHTDVNHSHIHIIINRITLDGKLVADSKDYARQEAIMRQIEKEYGLIQVRPSREANKRRATRGELEHALRTKNPSAKMILQKLVDRALDNSTEFSCFINRLRLSGATVMPNIASTGHISGISFTYDKIT